ncbi:MAG TPA: universal stress protein [Candidatus Binatia bacterium]|nr:universal stress protein [Candidatus Binatia bacterium]
MASQVKLSRIAINTILLATDFSAESQNAFYCAASLARRYGSVLFLTHVLPPEASAAATTPWAAPSDAVRNIAEKRMAELEAAECLKAVRHDSLVASGVTWDVLAQIVARDKVDLIVMGTHGDAGVKKLFLGSTAETVTRHATCPVLTVGPHVEFTSLERFSHILYASDFSSGSQRALAYALSLSEEDRADLTLLHVIQTKPQTASELLEWRRQDRNKLLRMVPPDTDLAYQPEIEVEAGIPEVEIVRLADTRKVDLLVMGSRAGGVLSTHVPWSTLHHVLRNAHCPVLTVRGE